MAAYAVALDDETQWMEHIRESLRVGRRRRRHPRVRVRRAQTAAGAQARGLRPPVHRPGPLPPPAPRPVRDGALQDRRRPPRLVHELKLHERLVRAHYHRYLDLSSEALSLMMIMDGAFLLEFLMIHHHAAAVPEGVTKRMAHLVDLGGPGRKSAHGLILRDMLMLENQIPLFVLGEILKAQSPQSVDESTTLLTTIVTGLMKELCPFKMAGNFPETSCDVTKHAHLLELLYHLLVPSDSKNTALAWSGGHAVAEDIEEQRPDGGGGQGQEEKPPSDGTGSEHVMRLFAVMWSIASRLKAGRLGHVMKPIELAVKAPWKMLTGIPGIAAAVKHPVESFMSAGASSEQEITIPSVSELVSSGVKFVPTNGSVSTIAFNSKTATFRLPAVTLDCNTEVVLRNLVAYESSAASGPLVLTRYTELMNGIIDTDDDVALLRKRGVVVNRMKKRDSEASKLWNGMSRAVQHSKVPTLDRVIEDVNRYYDGRWGVKTKRFMRKYVLSSWKMLTFLATISMLLLTALQAFCSVYTCSRWWFGDVVAVMPAE